jgi:predicted phage baseplate assembly protein
LRFGDGINGRLVPEDAVVRCEYQVGNGAAGNVGAEAISQFRPLAGALAGAIVRLWNPFDVVDGRDPEPVEKVLRRAPEAYRARQLRAITLADYEARAQEVPGVARAVARYAWTGSWRTVRIVVDPEHATELDPALRMAVADHLEAVRLIGEDIELRPPRFVPLVIDIAVCLHPDFWIEDVRAVLEQEFSDGWTPDGRHGFFHPDEWTFGQALHRSQLAGRVHAVTGVEHVVSIAMKRRNDPAAALLDVEQLTVSFDEIVLVQNDPDHLERGSIEFTFTGGRQ